MFYKDILLIDDSEPFCQSIQELLEDNGWSLDYDTDPESGLALLGEHEFKVVLLDIRMPNMSGLDFLFELVKRSQIQKNYIIVLTGEITIENAVDSLRLGAKDFIQKHAVVEYPDLFMERIEKGFAWQDERLENERLTEERKRAIEESRLIVKSVGHDMSGSYYASLMLRLQMLKKQIVGIKKEVDSCFDSLPSQLKDGTGSKLHEAHDKIVLAVENSIEKNDSVITLMGFFKELGEKLKHLGQAIDIDKSHKKTMDLNKLVEEAIHLFTDSQVSLNPDVKIIEEYAPEPLNIAASSEDLIRVFINLVENAYKAIDGKGHVIAKTYRQDGFVKVEISDDGCGIPQDRLEKIWRPDYTMWKGKQGTGLGLMICKKAVENHDGEISVASTEGQGTTFTVQFKLV